MKDNVIAVTGLSKKFSEKYVVNDLSLSVEQGKIYGFLGPNGSGKTTTIRMLCGLLKPDAGKGTCLGFDILTESKKIKQRVGYMTQKFSLYEDLSIQENLDFAARLYNLSDRKTRTDKTLVSLGLFDNRNQLTGTLSGGWKQRLALATCLLHEPELLLLDEPTAGVDPKARREFWDHIHALTTRGITVLVSTHYMDEAERCHELAYIAQGKLLVKGTLDEIIQSANLTTWTVQGNQEALTSLSLALKSHPAVSMLVPFGLLVHVSGTDPLALKSAITPYFNLHDLSWSLSSPTLEDVFIQMMTTKK